MNEILTEGVWTNAMLADFFRIKERSFRSTRAKKLEELKEYADFIVGRGQITITKVKDSSPYVKKRGQNRRIVTEEFPLLWEEYDTCIRCGQAIYEKRKKDLTATLNTVQQYTRAERDICYGSPTNREGAKKMGTKGRCNYCWCKEFINEQGECHYQGLTEEEETWLNEIIKDVFVKEFEVERIKKEALVWDSYKKGDLSEQELVESLKEARQRDYTLWTQVTTRMYALHNIEIKRATKTEKSAF